MSPPPPFPPPNASLTPSSFVLSLRPSVFFPPPFFLDCHFGHASITNVVDMVCVQLVRQYPSSFEFTGHYLERLVEGVYSAGFLNFAGKHDRHATALATGRCFPLFNVVEVVVVVVVVVVVFVVARSRERPLSSSAYVAAFCFFRSSTLQVCR